MIADAVALPVYNKNKVLAEETKDGKTSCGLCLPTAAGKLTRKFRLFTSMICLFVLLFCVLPLRASVFRISSNHYVLLNCPLFLYVADRFYNMLHLREDEEILPLGRSHM